MYEVLNAVFSIIYDGVMFWCSLFSFSHQSGAHLDSASALSCAYPRFEPSPRYIRGNLSAMVSLPLYFILIFSLSFCLCLKKKSKSI